MMFINPNEFELLQHLDVRQPTEPDEAPEAERRLRCA